MEKIVIIGGGASGLVAAVTAARNHASVVVLEQNSKLGRKIYATGNGKCNYTNEYMDESCYFGENVFWKHIFQTFTKENTISFFRELGIMPFSRNGYVYPASEQAGSMVAALEVQLQRMGVEIRLNAKVEQITPNASGGYELKLASGDYLHASKVIVASGLLASPKLGSGADMMNLLSQMGYQFHEVVPALCGFYCKGARFKNLSGVRTQAIVELLIDGKPCAGDRGEVQFTEYGISGIPVFQISHKASVALAGQKRVQVRLSFLPEYSGEELEHSLMQFAKACTGNCTYRELLNGYLPEKLALEVIAKCNLDADDFVQEQEVSHLVSGMKTFQIKVQRAREWEYAQVCAGGLTAEQICADTLESKLHPDLYFCGELLDVDGICGGYNLQWAWTSGYVAGSHASKE